MEIIFIAGLMGFIVCITISAFSKKYSRQMQVIAWIFGWAAITGICFTVTKNIFSIVIAVPFAAIAALVVMAVITLLIWGWFQVEKRFKVLSKHFK